MLGACMCWGHACAEATATAMHGSHADSVAMKSARQGRPMGGAWQRKPMGGTRSRPCEPIAQGGARAGGVHALGWCLRWGGACAGVVPALGWCLRWGGACAGAVHGCTELDEKFSALPSQSSSLEP
eukprot:366560-Chlamydomonas_euryale.AAC.10